nr:chloride channel protein [Mycobacterium vicinigordonae]
MPRPPSRNVDFFCAVVIVGLLSGVAGLATTIVLQHVEHLTYHYTFGSLLDGITGSSPVRQALGPMAGGTVVGAGWWLLRRRTEVPPLAGTITRHERVPRLTWSIDALLQVVLVGAGASLGREGAPRQFAAVLSDLGTGWLRRLSPGDREILLACAAGAGLGAVYAVPLAGTLFTLRILLNTWRLRPVGASLISSGLAVAIGSVMTHNEPELDWPRAESAYLLSVHGLALAPVAFVVGWVFNKVIAAARPAVAIRSWVLIPGLAAAGLLTGVCSHWWPELPGNGKSVLTVSLAAGMTLTSAAVILVLKPLLTAMFLRAGGAGGLLTPSLATGAAAGTVLVMLLNQAAGAHLHGPAMSLGAAAGVLAVTQGSPIWAAIFVWELARPPIRMLLAFAVTAVGAHTLNKILSRRRRPNPDQRVG